MKKLILVLAIALIASPAFALNVYLQREGDSNVVDVNYSGADVANPPRAFALDMKIKTGNAKFFAVTNYQQGESSSVNRRYGIYPARINIDSTGNGSVLSWGTPVASPNDPAPGALGTNEVVLEFASLYFGDVNAPVVAGNTSGKLGSLIIQLNGQATSFDINMVGEKTYRGGVVLEEGNQVDVNTGITYTLGAPPQPASGPTPTDLATCVALNPTLSWVAGTGANSHEVFFGTANPPTASQGIQTATTYAASAPANSTNYYWRIDEKNGIGTTTGTVWRFTTTNAAPGQAAIVSPASGATGQSRTGINLQWSAGSGALSHEVFFGTASTPTVSKGIQTATTYPTGTLVQGTLYYWRINEKGACSTSTAGLVWNFRVEECYKSSGASYSDWVNLGRPSCWCFQRYCRGDFDGGKVGVQWVQANDLTALVAAYGKNLTCLTQNPGYLCADFDHAKVGVQRVQANDLTVLVAYYGKNQTYVTVCSSSSVNFWSN